MEFQSWLETAERRVVIPFALYLAENIPPVAVRLRRDFGALLNLIQAHAILHQLNRARDEQGRIVATEDDYLVIRGLVADLLSDGVGATVSPAVRETVECVRLLADAEGVTVNQVAARLDLDRSAAQRRLQAARERGYVVNLEERRGRPARYAEGDPMPDEVVLLPHSCTPPDHKPAGQEGLCTCAACAEGVETPSPEVPSNGWELPAADLELIAYERDRGREDQAVAALLATRGSPPPPGFVGWTGYAVRAALGEVTT